MTGKSYLLLTDLVYSLIFVAYILVTVRFEPPLGRLHPATQLTPSQRERIDPPPA